MKYIFYIVIILIAYLGFYTIRIFYYSNYSPLPDIQPQNVTMGTGSPLKYIAAGDSTAVGEGASNIEQTYSYKILEYLSSTNKVEYTNVAVRGAQTKDLISEQIPKIIEFKPDIVTISISANDLTHLVSSEKIFNNYRQIITELEEKTTAKIYIANIPNFTGAKLLPFWYISILENTSKSINQKLSQLENERVKIINIHDHGWSQFPNISITYSADQFHPNDIGYNNWAEAFLSKIKDMN